MARLAVASVISLLIGLFAALHLEQAVSRRLRSALR
jgi:hypothetical protein